MSIMKHSRMWLMLLALAGVGLGVMPAMAQDVVADVDPVAALEEKMQHNINIVWTCVAAFLVFFMQAGFALVESGFTRAKNAINIIMKNLMDFSIGTIVFFLVGFGLMFGASNGFFGTTHFLMAGTDPASADWNWTFLIFQTVFAGTAATIVSGAMAERTKFTSYLIYSVFICGLIYPIFGSWAWGSLLDGGGWLEGIGFCDFAGSTVVHSVGGWLALAGAIVTSGDRALAALATRPYATAQRRLWASRRRRQAGGRQIRNSKFEIRNPTRLQSGDRSQGGSDVRGNA